MPQKPDAERRKSPEARGYPRVYLGRDTGTHARLLRFRGVTPENPKGFMNDDAAIAQLLDKEDNRLDWAGLRQTLRSRFGLDPLLLDEALRQYGMPPE